MAGETTTSSRVNSAGGKTLDHVPARSAINEVWDYVTYEISTAELQLNDVVQMLPVASGAIILEVILAVDDLDTATSQAVVLDIGDGSDDDRFIAASTAGQGGGVTRLNSVAGLLYKYTADDTIDLKVSTAPGTAAAGTVSLAVCMSFANLDSL
jgi:hypothetical protein